MTWAWTWRSWSGCRGSSIRRRLHPAHQELRNGGRHAAVLQLQPHLDGSFNNANGGSGSAGGSSDDNDGDADYKEGGEPQRGAVSQEVPSIHSNSHKKGVAGDALPGVATRTSCDLLHFIRRRDKEGNMGKPNLSIGLVELVGWVLFDPGASPALP